MTVQRMATFFALALSFAPCAALAQSAPGKTMMHANTSHTTHGHDGPHVDARQRDG